MTYAELIIAIAKLAKALPPAAFRLLVYLIARAIEDGTNELKASTFDLAAELDTSRDTVRAAAASLAEYILVTPGKNTAYSFHLPPEWFTEGRGLFTAFATVEKLPNSPGNQAATRLETRQHADEKPGSNSPGNQAANGQLAWKPGSNSPGNQAANGITRLETRQQITQNQQLTDGATPSIDRSVLSIPEVSYDSIDSIACAKALKPEQKEEASQLSDFMHFYMQRYGPTHGDKRRPDEQILARCLAIAPLGSLIRILRSLQERGTPAGLEYSWFVSVFAQRLQGIPPKVMSLAYRRAAMRREKLPQRDLAFTNRVSDETFGKVRQLA